MNIVFKIKQGHFIKNNSGQILGEADKDAYAFLGVILDAEKASTTEKCVFQKDFTTHFECDGYRLGEIFRVKKSLLRM